MHCFRNFLCGKHDARMPQPIDDGSPMGFLRRNGGRREAVRLMMRATPGSTSRASPIRAERSAWSSPGRAQRSYRQFSLAQERA